MHYRAGHSASNKDGIFILEFSNDGETGNRIFYGLKPNGRYYFPNEKPTKEIILEGSQQNNKPIKARYESMNAFVSLKNDINKNKEYFFSISTYFCLMEIYDFTNENVVSDAMYTYHYFGVPVFSFKFDLLESNYSNQMNYYLAFSNNVDESEFGDKMSIKKISFSNFNLNKDDIIASKPVNSKLNDRTVTSFLIDDTNEDKFKLLFVIYTGTNRRYKYNVYQLNDLTEKCIDKELFNHDLATKGRGTNGEGYGLYFKIIYLGNKDIAMLYFISNYGDQKPILQILTVAEKDGCFGFNLKIYHQIEQSINTNLVLNDFIKISKTRLAFISTKGESNFFIMLLDLYADNKNVQLRTYEHDISPYKMAKELSV